VIEATGAGLRYLPQYSSDFNLIEQAFGKLQAHHLRISSMQDMRKRERGFLGRRHPTDWTDLSIRASINFEI
jgi:transposase